MNTAPNPFQRAYHVWPSPVCTIWIPVHFYRINGVTAKKGFGLEPTISELIKITTSEIERYVRADRSYTEMAGRSSLERDAPFYIAGMAQRGSIEEKVKHTIEYAPSDLFTANLIPLQIREKEWVLVTKTITALNDSVGYWRNLGASVTFSSDKVKEYLLVIHEDIVQGWNFNDPGMVRHISCSC